MENNTGLKDLTKLYSELYKLLSKSMIPSVSGLTDTYIKREMDPSTCPYILMGQKKFYESEEYVAIKEIMEKIRNSENE